MMKLRHLIPLIGGAEPPRTANPGSRCFMLLMIDHYASFAEQDRFPAALAVSACAAPADGARIGERR